jgi:hypothetical protein
MMQTQLKLSGNNIYWRDFKWGTIYPSDSTFQLVPRTSKNVFRLFGNGLGLNADALQLLIELKITFIEGTLNGKSFKVKVDKWIKKGIRSPYSNEKVDPQVILKLEDIFSDDEDDNQLSFFGNA